MKPKSPPATRGVQILTADRQGAIRRKNEKKKEKRERDCSSRVGLYRPAEQSSKNDRKRRKGKGRDENGEERDQHPRDTERSRGEERESMRVWKSTPE